MTHFGLDDKIFHRDKDPIEPVIQVGIVSATYPALGVCDVKMESLHGDIVRIPYISPMISSSGTPWTEPFTVSNDLISSNIDAKLYDNVSYYKDRKRSAGKTDSSYVAEGQIFTIPVGAAVVILSSGDGKTLFEGGPLRVIIGCLNLTGLEVSRGFPSTYAHFHPDNVAAKWGFTQEGSSVKKNSRINVNENNIPDEVIFSDSDKSFLENNNIIPLIPSDIFWQQLQKAKIIPSILRSKIQRDAQRLQGLYFLGGNGGSSTAPSNDIQPSIIHTSTSESMIRMTKAGKIIIGSDFNGTVVECFSDEDSDYSLGSVHPGCYIDFGFCGGISYTEISSSDWLFQVFSRGITKFDRHRRTHAHDLTVAQHQNQDRQLDMEDVIYEDQVPDGTDFYDVEKFVLHGNRMQLNVDGLQISASPSQIFIGGKSLAEWLS